VGVGYSGLAIANGRLYGMDSVDGEEYLFARRTDDGQEVWRVRTARSPKDVYGGLGPRVTPTVSEGRIYTVSAEGDVLAVDAAGRPLWRRPLRTELGWRPPAEGTASSPLVADGRLYLMNGGTQGRAFLALDAQTGRLLWTAQDDQPSYSSPVRFDGNGVAQALFLGGSALFSLDPGSGRLVWRYPWPTPDFVNAASPLVIASDRVFISSGNDQGAALLRLRSAPGGQVEVEEVWRHRGMKNHFNSSVHHDGVLYGFDGRFFTALDLNSGGTLWRERGFGEGSVVLAGDHLVILGDEGEVGLVAPHRDGLRVLFRQVVLDGRTWTPPALAEGAIFLRGLSEIVRIGG
jgi:outer membrane protein assembly factor BamB